MIKSSSNKIYVIGASALINLILLLIIKYYSNGLPLSTISFSKTGNLINLILTIALLLGCIIILISSKQIYIGHLNFLSIISLMYLFPLILILLFNVAKLEFTNDYLFGFPFKKIIPLILLILNQILFLFVLFSLWYTYVINSLFAYLFSLISIFVFVLFLITLSLTFTYFNDKYEFTMKGNKYDYGIILGAAVWSGNRPSPIFSGRIEKGAKLYKDKVIRKIQLTGGNAPGEVSEAKAALNYLTEKFGVSKKNILIEETTSTTNEQIRYMKNQFAKTNNDVNFLFISDEFHLKRISEMADFYSLKASVVSSEYELNLQKSVYYRLRDSIGLIFFWFFAV